MPYSPKEKFLDDLYFTITNPDRQDLYDNWELLAFLKDIFEEYPERTAWLREFYDQYSNHPSRCSCLGELVEYLGRLEDPASEEVFLEFAKRALAHQNPSVRGGAMEGLLDRGSAVSIAMLKEHLTHEPSAEWRDSMMRSLQQR